MNDLAGENGASGQAAFLGVDGFLIGASIYNHGT
jgi:hypothetical protein